MVAQPGEGEGTAGYVAVPALFAPCACPTCTHYAQSPQDKFCGGCQRDSNRASVRALSGTDGIDGIDVAVPAAKSSDKQELSCTKGTVALGRSWEGCCRLWGGHIPSEASPEPPASPRVNDRAALSQQQVRSPRFLTQSLSCFCMLWKQQELRSTTAERGRPRDCLRRGAGNRCGDTVCMSTCPQAQVF